MYRYEHKTIAKAIVVNLVALLGALLGLVFVVTPAFATPVVSPCSSSTSCTLAFTGSNSGLGLTTLTTGNYGTVTLTLNNNTGTITVDIYLAPGFSLISTGFPGGSDSNGTSYGVGFSDSLGTGNLTATNFTSGYSGIQSDNSQNLKFDGFGSVSDAAAHSTLGNTSGLQEVMFDVGTGTQTGFTNVDQIVNKSTGGGSGSPVFIADVYDANANSGQGATGLLGAFFPTTPLPPASVPDPSSLALLAAGLLGCGLFINRRRRVEEEPFG